MVEPSRKADLGQLGHVVALIPKPTLQQSLIFVSHHPTHPGKLNLRSFRDGDPTPARKGWLGPYRGRPKLIAELAPAIEQIYLTAPARSLARVKYSLRCFWRLFDKYDRFGPVLSLTDISDIHGAIQLRDGFDRAETSTFLTILNTARRNMGLPWMAWTSNEQPTKNANLPERRDVALIYQYVKRQAYRAIDRIESASARGESVAPNKDELFQLLVLFLLRTGWNRSTALALDVRTCVTTHPTSLDHHVVRAVKVRGNTEQTAIGLNKSVLSPGNILKFLERVTERLRHRVAEQIDSLQNATHGIDPDKWRVQMATLNGLLHSPWLAEANTSLGVMTIDPNSSLLVVLREMNASATTNCSVPETIGLGDLRDAYIAFAYEYSGYSWMVAKIAAGHKSLGALKAYLRQRQWKAHSEKKVLLFGESMWTLIEKRKIVEPAVLHAMVERGQVTDVQIERWLSHKDRTRVGTGCSDFKNPPQRIAPEHIEGTGCRVQRCTLCEHAIVFEDSADHLCRRLTELQAIQQKMAIPAWMESSFPEEVQMTEATLAKLNQTVVSERMAFWSEQIASGKHRPVDMEGTYVIAAANS